MPSSDSVPSLNQASDNLYFLVGLCQRGQGGYYTTQLVGCNRKGGRGIMLGMCTHNLQCLPPDLLLHRPDLLSWPLQVG